MAMLKRILSSNIVFYALLMLVFAQSVDWRQCFHQRGRYLLGIYYNGHFSNQQDGTVYREFLKRHKTTQESFQNTLMSSEGAYY